MTNTYPDDAPYDLKLLEEVRCLRCVNERILRALDEGLFVEYQLEKFLTDKVHEGTINRDKMEIPERGDQAAVRVLDELDRRIRVSDFRQHLEMIEKTGRFVSLEEAAKRLDIKPDEV